MDADLFLQQFGHLAQGEGGIKKLRDVILQLAVRGKLVDQNPADEPAEALLKKIAATRKNFPSDYKLKATKENQPISVSQIPHKLPHSWQWVRLSNVGIIVGGGTPSSGNPEYFCDNGGIAWLTPADMYALRSKFISHGRRDLTPAGLSNSSAQLMPKGSVLFSSRAPIGYVAIAVNEVTTNQGFKSCVPFIGEMSEYVYYYLKSAVRYIESLASGTTFMEVSGKVVANILFPLPPLAEQKRIVAKVDELMALCDKLEAEQNAQRTLKTQAVQSILYHLTSAESPASFGTSLNILERTFDNWFDNLATVKHLRATILQLAIQGKLTTTQETNEANPLPTGWQLVPLERLLSFGPQNGYSPKPVDYETKTKSLTLSATTSGSFDSTKFKFIDEVISEDSHLWLEKDDILIQRGNSPEYVGVSAIYNGEKRAFIYPDLMMKIRITRDAVPEYIHIVLLAPTTRAYFLKNATGTSGSMPKINQSVVKNTPIPLPPLAEQKRIVAKADELMTLCDQLEAHITHTQTLNTHLMDSLIHRMTAAA